MKSLLSGLLYVVLCLGFLVLFLLVVGDVSCAHNLPYGCSKGMSDEGLLVCCKVYCGDKKMDYRGSVGVPGEEFYRCQCDQPKIEVHTHFKQGFL